MGEMKMIYYVIALFVIAIDQISKWLIVKNMELGTSIPIIDNVLYITSHRNRGAAWGILENKMWFFYIITVIFVAIYRILYEKVCENGQASRYFIRSNFRRSNWQLY